MTMNTTKQNDEEQELGSIINDKRPPKVNTYVILALLLLFLLCIPAVGWLGRIYKSSAAILNTIALPIIALVVIALFIILVLRVFKRLIA